MITLKYKHISDMAFAKALGKIANHGFDNHLTSYNVAKIVRRFDGFVQQAQVDFIALLKTYAALDEKGEFIPDEGVPGTYTIPKEKSEEFKNAKSEFEAKEFQLDCNKIRLEDLKSAGLTAVEFIALEPCVTDIPRIEATAPQHQETESAAAAN